MIILGLVSLYEMIRFYADFFMESFSQLSACELRAGDENRETQSKPEYLTYLKARLEILQCHAHNHGFSSIESQCKRIVSNFSDRDMVVSCGVVRDDLRELRRRCEDEMKSHFFLHLDPKQAKDYENPCDKWEPILEVFPDVRDDVEEMNKCRALERYPASVFHALLAVEHGLIDLGNFLKVTDPKQGWDATCKTLAKILAEGRKVAPIRIQRHWDFLELVNKDMQSMKLAWRNKVNHAANKLVIETSDFKPQVAEKIIIACHGFMLLLATEGPRKKRATAK